MPTWSGGENSLTSAENWAESATTAKPQTMTSANSQNGARPKISGVSAAQIALVHIAQIATRARPAVSASHPASTHPAVPLAIARNAASDPADSGSLTPAATKLAAARTAIHVHIA